MDFLKRNGIKEAVTAVEHMPGYLLNAKPLHASLVKNKKNLAVVVHRIRMKKDR